MAFEFKIEMDVGFLRVQVFGNMRIEDIKRVMQSISASDNSDCNRRLWDMKQCSLHVSSDELIDLAEYSKNVGLPDGRGALLA